MKKTAVVLLMCASLLPAQSAGNAGLSFLKIGFGARNIAMGDLGVVAAEDASALYYNPAILGIVQKSQITITHNQWIQDVSSEMIGVSFDLWGLPMAMGFNTTSVSDIELRTKPGEPESTFNANYFFGSLSASYGIADDLAAGVTFKYIYEGMLTDDATGYAFDIGLYHDRVIDGLSAGVSLRNIGSMSELREDASELPVDVRAGAAYEYKIERIDSDITVLGGIQKYTATDDLHLHFGAEIFYDELIAVRGGYMSGYESKGLTAGLGIQWNSVNFDYAYAPFDYDLGNSHIISLMYTF